MILQVKLYADCNESSQNRLEWLKILEMLLSELRLILKTSSVTPDFFYVFIESYHFLPSVKVLKKSVCGKFLGANALKVAYYSFSETSYRALRYPATRQYLSRVQKWRN